jgi:DNA gyrase subunit A
MVTEHGSMKKTVLSEFSNPRKNGIGAISLDKHDLLCDVKLTDGTHEIVIGTHDGIAIRFPESEVRSMGRAASGVRAIRLDKGDRVIGAVGLKRTKTTILVATEQGFGKRSDLAEYRLSHRGGKGVATLRATEKTGKMMAIKEVQDTEDIVVVTTQGMVIRQHADEVRVSGRNTSGVRLIRLDNGDKVAAVAVVTSEDEEEKKLEEADKQSRPNGSSSNGKGQEELFGSAKNGKKKTSAPAREMKKTPTAVKEISTKKAALKKKDVPKGKPGKNTEKKKR